MARATVISLLHDQICRRPFYFHWRNLSSLTRHHHYHHHQLPLSELPPPQPDYSVPKFSSNPFYHLLGLCRNFRSLEEAHGLLVVHGLADDLLCSTKLISLYGSFGCVGLARFVFDRIPQPDFYSWKVMLRWYFLNDLYPEMIGFYSRMRKCVTEHDDVVFSIVVKACSELRLIDVGRKVHCQIIKAGEPDSFVLTGLVDMYAKCGDIEYSSAVFDENLDGNVVSWTSMITGYVQNGYAREGLILFNRMREGLIEGNQFTLGTLVTACTKLGALHQGRWLHGYVIKSGIELNCCLVTALLDMYVKCGVIKDARSVFDELPRVDVFSWSAMIAGYSQCGCPLEALKLFVDKKWVGVFPDVVTIVGVISACAQLSSLNLGRTVHGLGVKLGLEDPIIMNAMVDMYAKCHENRDALYLFETMSDKDLVAWNSIISGYSQNGSAHEALVLFNQMRKDSILPDAVTLVSVFSSCASLGALRVGSCLHAYFMKEGLLSSNVYVGTALLSFYAKCGDAESARTVFDGMEDKSVVTWSAMIDGYGIQGDSSRSLALFGDMLKEKLEPNETVFTAVLSACSHTGMVERGWKLFVSMCQDYNFVPSLEHYACMVDLLSRAGRLEEAWDFIERMPVRPDVSLFGAFLHGCGLHSRFDLGELAIRRMLKLHPDEASYYVLMRNLYASDGRWSQVKKVREVMTKRGLIKSPGCSLLEMDIDDSSLPGVAACA